MLAAPPAARGDPGTLCSSGRWGHVQCIRPAHFVFDTCQAIGIFARDNDLDPGFFARLIWQESRFDPNALSPARARGIAQFIDSTAALRGLRDSYNPALALEHSAEYLGELVRRFGNAGLAAVAYNGGERRAEGLVAETGGLAQETIDYIEIITGLTAETWRDAPPRTHDFRLQGDKPFDEACHDLARNRRLTAYPRPEPALKPWGVQIAFGTSKSAARDKISRFGPSCRAALRGETVDYIYQKSRASPRGGYYMARVGRDAQKAAWSYCDTLKANGCICAVYRNG
nr:lytic transglycosylase domain-containing protein [Puniceibacterium confluentis]